MGTLLKTEMESVFREQNDRVFVRRALYLFLSSTYLEYSLISLTHEHSGYIDNLGVIGTLDIVFQTNKHYNKSWQHRVDKTYGANADYPVDKILSRNRGNDDDLKHCPVDDGDVRVVSATAI